MPKLAWRAAIRAKAREGEVRESCTRHTVQHELPQARSLPERELPGLCSLGRAGVQAVSGDVSDERTDMEADFVQPDGSARGN